jgi:hypothetical protein
MSALKEVAHGFSGYVNVKLINEKKNAGLILVYNSFTTCLYMSAYDWRVLNYFFSV